MVSRARALRQSLTPAEARLWVALRRLRDDGFHFRRQAPVQGHFLDFVCKRRRLVVEIDGYSHDSAPAQVRDARRDASLARAGYRTIRFNNAEVLRDLEGVVFAIREALAG